MKVLIDTERKQISIIGIIGIEELNDFITQHNLKDYVLAAYELNSHFVPHNWEIKPPFYPTCTTEPVNPDDEPKLDSRKQYTGGELLRYSNGEEFYIPNFNL